MSGRIYSSVNQAVFERIPATARSVLDVGCGDGTLGEALKRRAPCTVTGITDSREEHDIAASSLDAVVLADIERADFSQLGRFDAIVCSHVLEHLRDPRRVLFQLRSRLAADGRLVVALPNPLVWRQRVEFTAGRFRYTQGGIMDDTHLRFFDWVTASHLVESSGYHVLEAFADGGLPGSRFLPRFLAAWLDRIATVQCPGLFGVQFVITARP